MSMKTMFGKTSVSDQTGAVNRNKVLNEYFQAEGIIRQSYAPYVHEQNHTAERKIKYLIEMTTCLPFESNLLLDPKICKVHVSKNVKFLTKQEDGYE